jgi:hypothetical protein
MSNNIPESPIDSRAEWLGAEQSKRWIVYGLPANGAAGVQ